MTRTGSARQQRSAAMKMRPRMSRGMSRRTSRSRLRPGRLPLAYCRAAVSSTCPHRPPELPRPLARHRELGATGPLRDRRRRIRPRRGRTGHLRRGLRLLRRPGEPGGHGATPHRRPGRADHHHRPGLPPARLAQGRHRGRHRREATFGDVGAVQVAAAPDDSAAALALATMDAATTERSLLLAEIYRRGSVWRFRAVGQGHDHGLGDLARGYGVAVDD